MIRAPFFGSFCSNMSVTIETELAARFGRNLRDLASNFPGNSSLNYGTMRLPIRIAEQKETARIAAGRM